MIVFFVSFHSVCTNIHLQSSKKDSARSWKWTCGDRVQTPRCSQTQIYLEKRFRTAEQLFKVSQLFFFDILVCKITSETRNCIVGLNFETWPCHHVSSCCRMLIWDDGTLEILNATKSDEGSYTCYAENDRGKDNSTGTLTITGENFYLNKCMKNYFCHSLRFIFIIVFMVLYLQQLKL